ncbi:MAG: restriction endonuclease subunit S [Novosphingobium sp.]|uniref:restriction endonuclease subunit S n=1 Tax=Novosphingobium sp. TaxID=1874826 RepID=UPI003B9BEABB
MKAGWKTVKLTDVAELSGRIGWKGLTAKEYTQSGPYFLSVHSLNYGDFVDFRDAFHISQARYDESPEIMLQTGDVLICKDGAGIGKVGIVGELPGQTTINSSLLLIRATQKIEPKYLYYILMSPYFQAIVQSRLEGATTPHLYQRDIAGFPIHLPPLDEQRRIVAVLDTAFAGIATATANAQKNLTNARALFQRYLDKRIASCVDGGTTCRLEEIIGESLIGLVKSTREQGSHYSFPYIKMHNIMNDNGFNGDKIVNVSATLDEQKKYSLRTGDFLFNTRNSHELVGKTCYFDLKCDNPVLFNNNIMRIRFLRGISSKFVFYAFSSTPIRRQLEAIKSGTTNVSAIYFRELKDILISHPDEMTQSTIVEQLDELSCEKDRLAITYESKLTALTELKQSLLQKAFAGELT